MKIKDVIVEAGYKPGLGHAIGRGLLGAASTVAKAFDPKLGSQLGAMHQATDVKGQRAAKASALKKRKGAAKTAKELAATAAANPTPKSLSAFSEILPKDVSVIRRDPLVIRYQKQDYRYDTRAKHWTTVAGKAVPLGIEQVLMGFADDINTFDPPPPSLQAASNVPVARVKTSQGLATKASNGKWFLGNKVVTDPEIISSLDQTARDSGQIQ